MKAKVKKLLLILAVVCISGGMMTGCVKAWEDERIEVIRRPQVDIVPEPPGWDGPETETIG